MVGSHAMSNDSALVSVSSLLALKRQPVILTGSDMLGDWIGNTTKGQHLCRYRGWSRHVIFYLCHATYRSLIKFVSSRYSEYARNKGPSSFEKWLYKTSPCFGGPLKKYVPRQGGFSSVFLTSTYFLAPVLGVRGSRGNSFRTCEVADVRLFCASAGQSRSRILLALGYVCFSPSSSCYRKRFTPSFRIVMIGPTTMHFAFLNRHGSLVPPSPS